MNLHWCPICRSFYKGHKGTRCPVWGQHTPPAEWFWDDEVRPVEPLDPATLLAIDLQIAEWDAWQRAKQDLQIPFRCPDPWDVQDN